MLDSLIAAQPDALGIDIHWRRLRRLVHDVQVDMQDQAAALGEQLFDASDPADNVVRLPLDARRA